MAAATALLPLVLAPSLAFADDDDLTGEWKLNGNRYRSKIELSISHQSIGARIGCSQTGFGYAREGDRLTVANNSTIVIEAPCYQEENRDPEAWDYWHEVSRRLNSATQMYLIRGRLMFRGDGYRLIFVRKRE